MRKWRKNEIKTGPLQRMFILACSTKMRALEENIQLAVGAGAARYWGGDCLYRNSTKGVALEENVDIQNSLIFEI